MKTKLYTFIVLLVLTVCQNVYGQVYSKYGIRVAGSNDCSSGGDSIHLYEPEGVYRDAAGSIYIPDYDNHRVQKWTKGAKYGVTVAGQSNGTSGTDSAHLNYPSAVCVDASGNVYVVDGGNNRVQKWAPGAKYGITVAGDPKCKSGTDSTHLIYPWGIVVDKSGNIYIGDFGNNRVQKYSKGAKYGVTVAGQKSGISGKDSAHLNGIEGIFVDTSGNVYVADVSNNRVQKWAPGAKFGKTVAGQSNCVSGTDTAHLYEPNSVWVDKKGNVYVDDFANRLLKWSPGATYGVTLIGLNKSPAYCDSTGLRYPTGFTIDSAGNIYIAEGFNNGIFKWTLKYGTDNIEIKEGVTTLTIFPNPTTSQFTLDLNTTNTTDKAHIQILNLLGQLVNDRVVENINGKVHTTFYNTELTKGVYLVKVLIGGESTVQKLLIE